MKYRNAAEILPPQLLQELQKYVQGETLYIPKVKRASWGMGTGARTFFSKRDTHIRSQFSRGVAMEKLSEEHFISEDAVKKIVYKKGEIIMNTNEINYSKYFWQNELVRVRSSKPDDSKLACA